LFGACTIWAPGANSLYTRAAKDASMRILVAPDSFKECLPAAEVAEALAAGWRAVRPADDLTLLPLADGGEGTTRVLIAATGGRAVSTATVDALGRPLRASFGLLPGGVAVVEVAAASGLATIPPARRRPRDATSRGTGDLIRAALDAGAGRIVVGLGGSATNDAGAGLAQALGYRLLDSAGRELPPGGAALARLARIDAASADSRIARCVVEAACDVDNPLCGPRGASAVFGPQKGASPAEVAELDAALAHWSGIAGRDLGRDPRDVPGAGAAGGLGAGAIVYLGASLRPGLELVAAVTGLATRLSRADLVLTGEGRLDAQSLHGKTPVGLARMAAPHGVPVIAVAGAVRLPPEAWREAGFAAAFGLDADGEDHTPGTTRARLAACAARIAGDFSAGG
jgi:glycerate kinase